MEVGLTVFGRRFELRTKAIPLQPLSGRGGWWNIVREPYLGAWQRNTEIRTDTVLAYSAVFACVTLIAGDISKMCLRLVQEVADDIWDPIDNPAFSPVLRRPNHYQIPLQFIEQWVVSKLVHGNAYVLKGRDGRGIVTAMYVLDPTRVTPLVASDGSLYYQLKRDDLSGLSEEQRTVPASEIIHDRMVSIYHPLIGVSPIYASGLAATQGLAIQSNSNSVFANGSIPGGVLSADGVINDETAARVKAYWETEFSGDNAGKVAVLGSGMTYKQLSYNAVDLQLIDQLKWTGENVCSAFKVPPYMIGIGPPPPYANVEPLVQQYYQQCIQANAKSIEDTLDKGLGLGKQFGNTYGTEFDIDDLIWMDTATRTKAASDSIGSGSMSPNEARKKYQGLGPIAGGDSCYLQEQNYSLEALAKRDASDDPFAKKPEAQASVSPAPADARDDTAKGAAFYGDVLRKTLAGLTHAA